MPSGDLDARFLIEGLDFSTKNAYASILRDPDEYINANIWETKVPNKSKVFAWLPFVIDSTPCLT